MQAQTFHAFCEWLSYTPFSMLLQNVEWIIPAVQCVHIVCIAIVIGAIGIIDLRMLGLAGRSQPISDMSTRMLPWIWISLVILLITGSLLAVAEPVRSLENPAFQTKMILVVMVSFMTLFFQKAITSDKAFWELSPQRRMTARLTAIASLGLWIAIVFAGRWIAYMDLSYGG